MKLKLDIPTMSRTQWYTPARTFVCEMVRLERNAISLEEATKTTHLLITIRHLAFIAPTTAENKENKNWTVNKLTLIVYPYCHIPKTIRRRSKIKKLQNERTKSTGPYHVGRTCTHLIPAQKMDYFTLKPSLHFAEQKKFAYILHADFFSSPVKEIIQQKIFSPSFSCQSIRLICISLLCKINGKPLSFGPYNDNGDEKHEARLRFGVSFHTVPF